MIQPTGPNEIRVDIRTNPAFSSPVGAVPAPLFKKLFDAVLAALIAADREIHAKIVASEFRIAHLSATPCEFGFIENVRATGRNATSSIGLFRRCAGGVYRSDYQILLKHPRLTRALQRIVAALDPAYVVVVRYHDGELPLDAFFRRQVDRIGLADEARSQADMWFGGRAITAFDGRLEAIDYRGEVWKGRLTLADSETQIECVFDKGMGEDALNPFGNKDVSITGRAVYAGDSQLPERVEVMTIEERPRATAPVDVRGVLAPAAVGDWEDGLDHLHEQ